MTKEMIPLAGLPGSGGPDHAVGPWDVTDAVYYGDKTCLSCSMMRDFAASPRLFEAKYVSNSQADPLDATDAEDEQTGEKESAALLFGRAFHEAVLRPDEYAKRFLVMPKFGQKKTDKEDKAKWVADHAGCDFVTERQAALVKAMAASVRRNRLLAPYLNHPNRLIEQAARWKACLRADPVDLRDAIRTEPHADGFPDTVWMKAKYDIVVPGECLIDVKTIAKIDGKLASHFADYGYHYRQEWYAAGAERAGFVGRDGEDYSYLFLVVSKEHPHDSVMVSLDHHFGLLGRREVIDSLQAYAGAAGFIDWSAPGERGFVTISPPKWKTVT